VRQPNEAAQSSTARRLGMHEPIQTPVDTALSCEFNTRVAILIRLIRQQQCSSSGSGSGRPDWLGDDANVTGQPWGALDANVQLGTATGDGDLTGRHQKQQRCLRVTSLGRA